MRRFWSDRKGNVAVLFGLALIPVIGVVGAAVDYSRAAMARTKMQAALDATALFLSKCRNSSGGYCTTAEMLAKATPFFNATYTESEVVDIQLAIDTNEQGRLKISASGMYPPQIVGILGINEFPISASTEAKWGSTRLRVALVLDTTGSMRNDGKMDALKTAAKNLIDQLKAVVAVPEDIYVSIVPFVKDVNIGRVGNFDSGIDSNYANWLDFTCWKQEPPYLRSAAPANCPGPAGNWIGSNSTTWKRAVPGAACPFTTSSFGFQCYDRPRTVSGASTTNYIPYNTSSSYFGLICPGRSTGDSGARYSYLAGIHYNGCYTSVMDTTYTWTVATGSSASCGNIPTSVLPGDTVPWCSCSGSGSGKTCTARGAKHYWRGANPTEPSPAGPANPDPTAALASGGWNGCLTDRDQNYDVSNSAPTTATPATLFKAEQYHYCNPTLSTGVMPIMGLSNDWTALKAKIDSLQPDGNTNQGIGISLGWQSLTKSPFIIPAYDEKYTYKKVIILMSDGLNTQNRWSTSASSIDAREATTCSNAKADNYTTIYAIQVNTDGDPESAVLKGCAGSTDKPNDTSKFFMLTDANQLITTFEQIGQEISDLHLSH
jgi:Flp pilus assembly protein TadG